VTNVVVLMMVQLTVRSSVQLFLVQRYVSAHNIRSCVQSYSNYSFTCENLFSKMVL
jgi:hypothetical protein